MFNLKQIEVDYEKLNKFIHADGNYNYIDALKLSEMIVNNNCFGITIHRAITRELYFLFDGEPIFDTSKDAVINQLIKLGTPEKFFKSRKNKSKTSFDANVLEKCIEFYEHFKDRGTLSEMQDHILEYLYLRKLRAKYSSIVSSVSKKINTGSIYAVPEKGWCNRNLLEIDNIYVTQSTGRPYAREEGIVSMHMEALKCFTVPDGTIMLSNDAGQIDLVVAYSMFMLGYDEKLDKLMREEKKDRYRVLYEYIYHGDDENLTYFYAHRDDIKHNILAGMYGAGMATLTKTLFNNDFNTAVINFFKNHKGLIKIKNKLKGFYELFIPFEVTSYFGYTMMIDCKDEKGRPYGYEEFLSKVFPCIVQSTSFGIIGNWIISVKEEANARGLKDEDMFINMERHDETVSRLSLDGLKNIDIIYDKLEIRVGNWLPIYMDNSFYVHYKEEHESVEFQNIIDKITALANDYTKDMKHTEFIPYDNPEYTGIPEIAQAETVSRLTLAELYRQVLDLPPMAKVPPTKTIISTLKTMNHLTSNLTFDEYMDNFNKIKYDGKVYDIEDFLRELESRGLEYVNFHTKIGSKREMLNENIASNSSANGYIDSSLRKTLASVQPDFDESDSDLPF